MQFINFRPPRIGMLFATIAATAHRFLAVWDNYIYSFPVAGVILGLTGFSIMIWAWFLFKKSNVAICPTAHTSRLLTSGVYRFSRNPMYLGMVSMLLGLALLIGSPPFYLAAVCYFVVLDFVFCPYEESKLLKTFGREFSDYRARVRRWL